jgi:hypothetical protein
MRFLRYGVRPIYSNDGVTKNFNMCLHTTGAEIRKRGKHTDKFIWDFLHVYNEWKMAIMKTSAKMKGHVNEL